MSGEQKHIIVRTDTLGDLLAEGIGPWAWCNDCCRSGVLDVVALAVAHGESTRTKALADKLRCRHCGSRDSELRMKWPCGQANQ